MQMPEVQTIDSLKHIIDSISKLPLPTQSELMNKVDSFYNNAYEKVLYFYGMIAFLVPASGAVLNYFQNQIAFKKMLDKTMATTIDEMKADFRKQFEGYQNSTEGVSYHIQADIYVSRNEYESAFAYYIAAMRCYFEGGDFGNFENALEDLEKKSADWGLNAGNISSINEEYQDYEYYLADVLISVLKKDESGKYLNSITKLRNILAQIDNSK